jgi:transposase
MLQLTPQMKLLLAIEPTDLRKGIDGLAAFCQRHLQHDPFSGGVFVFHNKTKTSVKFLVYDGNGFLLCLKRFSQGKLKWWPTSAARLQSITPTALHILLSQGDPTDVRLTEWRPIQPSLD